MKIAQGGAQRNPGKAWGTDSRPGGPFETPGEDCDRMWDHMAHTYCSSLFHCVFSTKGRRELIAPEVQTRLWAYMGASHGNMK